jgi:hypothetical protein
LTDLALETLARESMPLDSIEAELRLWHALEVELKRDRRWQHSLADYGEVAPLGTVLRQVVSRAARRVAGEMEPILDSHARHAESTDGYLCQV